MNIKYRLRFSLQSTLDLDEAYEYISHTLTALEAAKSLMRKIDVSVKRLQDFPLSGSICQDEALASMRYRRLVVDNFVVIYLLDDTQKIVYIVRVFYGKSDYTRFIK